MEHHGISLNICFNKTVYPNKNTHIHHIPSSDFQRDPPTKNVVCLFVCLFVFVVCWLVGSCRWNCISRSFPGMKAFHLEAPRNCRVLREAWVMPAAPHEWIAIAIAESPFRKVLTKWVGTPEWFMENIPPVIYIYNIHIPIILAG